MIGGRVTAEHIAQRYSGTRCGDGWSIDCPCGAHRRRKSRAKVWLDADGRVRVYSYSCDHSAVVAGLRADGLALGGGPVNPLTAAQLAAKREQDARDIEKRRQWALSIWRQCRPGRGTAAERYLESRAIELSEWPSSLRFHPELAHGKRPPEGECGSRHPALVALAVDVNGRPMAVHRTYLLNDGTGKADCAADQKMTCGPRTGCAVRLASAAECLLVGEGIESTASAMQLGGIPGWAALAANGIEALELPKSVRSVWIAADADEKGRGERAAHVAARRWRAEDRCVRIIAPARFNDYNDVLRARRTEVNHAAA